jgi:hypothetical protein
MVERMVGLPDKIGNLCPSLGIGRSGNVSEKKIGGEK